MQRRKLTINMPQSLRAVTSYRMSSTTEQIELLTRQNMCRAGQETPQRKSRLMSQPHSCVTPGNSCTRPGTVTQLLDARSNLKNQLAPRLFIRTRLKCHHRLRFELRLCTLRQIEQHGLRSNARCCAIGAIFHNHNLPDMGRPTRLCGKIQTWLVSISLTDLVS
jgi:hypothetical protein